MRKGTVDVGSVGLGSLNHVDGFLDYLGPPPHVDEHGFCSTPSKTMWILGPKNFFGNIVSKNCTLI